MGRMERVNHQLKREISLIVQRELTDPRLEFVSILSVDTSPDLKFAKVFFSVLGEYAQVDRAVKALKGASGMVRKLVGQRMSMRFTPEIIFCYDDSIESGARMDQLLKEINEEYQQNHSGDKVE